MKILRMEIERCNDCPFMKWDYSKGNQLGADCYKQHLTLAVCFTNVSENTEIRIPDWCPLKDAEKGEGDESD